jgi:phage terminase Nu1 subunit (DNA packaging protein)
MEKTELNLALQRGKLVDTDEVRTLWADIVTTARNKMIYIPASVAQRLVMLNDPVEIKEILEREIRAALEGIATCRLPEAAAPEEESEEAEE